MKIIIFSFLMLFTLDNSYSWFKIPSTENSIHLTGNFSSDKIENDHINLIVWNLFKSRKKTWLEDYRYLKNDSDLFLMQEVMYNEFVLNTWSSFDQYGYYFATSFILRRTEIATGLAQASRFKPLNFVSHRPRRREMRWATPKLFTTSVFERSNDEKPLLVINIHSLNFVFNKAHRSQFLQMEPFIRNHDGPIILAGDFNPWSKRKIRWLRQWTSELGLSEIIFEKKLTPKTNERRDIFGIALDYVFIKDLEYEKAHRLEFIDGSDHKPLKVKLKFIDSL